MLFRNNRYYTIKEAVKYSTGEYGLIAVYIGKDGKETYFLNGKPFLKFKD